MPIKRGNIAIIGTDDGISGYLSHGLNIIRHANYLSAERVKKDPAFQGFRKSSNRMQEASRLAAHLYNQIPKALKRFSLYRLLTGEVLKMIKTGTDKLLITDQLQKLYIDPVLQQPVVNDPARQIKSELPVKTMNMSAAGYLYIGRVKGNRRLKIWLRS